MSDDDAATESVRHARTLVGRTLKDKWRLERLLGVGGMASVYEATHRNGDRVAVKVLHPMYAVQPSVRTRFLREGYAANSVGHPGAVSVRDDEVDGDVVFLVMELLEGETLDARWERNGVLPLEEVCNVGEQMLDVLAAAHDKGIWHRDVKPANVFLTTEGRVKLLDFGIAKVKDASSGGDLVSVTQTGAVVGTPAFMSPEQVLAAPKQIDAQSDVWSVGATLFSLLTGRYVHQGTTPNEVLVKTATEAAPPLRSVWPQVPEAVAAVIDRALIREKAQRWPDARSMRAALCSARDGLGLAQTIAGMSAPPLARITSPFAETIGSDPDPREAALVHTPNELLTTVHDAASSVSIPIPHEVVSSRRKTRKWWAAGIGMTLLAAVGAGVALVARMEPTASAAEPTVPSTGSVAPAGTSLPAETPSVSPVASGPVEAPVVLPEPAGPIQPAPPPKLSVRPAVRRPEPKPPEPAPTPPASAGVTAIPWDKR